jgi:hypothetical protein
MTKGLKRALLAAVVVAAGVAGVTALRANEGTEADKAALRDIKAAYEMAVNQDNMGALQNHVAASGFSATMATGHKVNSFQEFRSYWTTMKGLVGIGAGLQGRYEATLQPQETLFVGGYAFSAGTSTEFLKTDVVGANNRRESNEYRFNSLWYTVSTKENGVWKLKAARVVVDPFRSTFSDAKLNEIASLATTALTPKKG